MQQDILITGAGGFIGQSLVRALLATGAASDANGRTLAGRRIVVTDRDGLDALPGDTRLSKHRGDIGDPAFAAGLLDANIGLVFHLAGIVSGAAEAQFDASWRVNFESTRALLDACRHAAAPVRLVFASSIAVFGEPVPNRIDDATFLRPTLSYGSQKVACEYLINDYARRGWVDGRAIRLPGIVVRPPLPNGALSAFNSDLIREPLAGRPIVCPVSAGARIWMQSIDHATANLLHAARLAAASLGLVRAVTLPAVAVTIAEIIDALATVGGERMRSLVTFAPDPQVEAMFGRWPIEHPAARARALGFTCDSDVLAIVRNYAQSAGR